MRHESIQLPDHPKPRALVIFFPPATGDNGAQREEAASLRDSGLATLLYEPPYLRARRGELPRGGPADPVAELSLWRLARAELAELLDSGFRADQVALCGKNLGGSVAAYAGAGRVRTLAVTGAVPRLSRFWAESMHPVALEQRQGFSPEQLQAYEAATREFDLTLTLPAFERTLVQLGSRDPWIEPVDTRALACEIRWQDDDHSMSAEASVRERREFLVSPFAGRGRPTAPCAPPASPKPSPRAGPGGMTGS